jgi:alkane 1-monooxygenase
MSVRATKYLSPLIVFCLAIISFNSSGIACYGALIFAWVLVPLAELFFSPDPANLTAAEEELARHDKTYDRLLYAVVILHLLTLFYFLYRMQSEGISVADTIGRVGTMGLLLGTFGINIGHELGHRPKTAEKWLARFALMSSLYIHFYIEHNKGHHKRVATHEDPATARYGEPVYFFWFRSIINCYIGAWSIANKECRKKGQPVLSWQNEMLQTQIMQAIFLGFIFWVAGWRVALLYCCAALIGILLLETVNYIEHYGLSRKKTGVDQYERTQPAHSWNSDHILGRLLLFELSRHSDHHYMASRKYQVLRHHDDAPQMPTGYPGMMMMSLLPPVWFKVMHKRIRSLT